MSDSKQSDQAEQEKPVWKMIDVLLIIIGTFSFGFLAILLLFGFLIISPAYSPSIILSNEQPTIFLSIGAAVIEALALICSVYLFGIKRKNLAFSDLGLRKISNKWLAISIGLGLIAIPISSLVAYLTQLLLGLSAENPQLPFLAPNDISTSGMIFMSIFVGIVIPFAEELFFRGVLFLWLRKRFGLWISVIFSALIFGIIHGDIVVGITAFVLGILLALVFEYSKSLWSSIIVHSINNSIQIFMLYILILIGQQPLNI
jgi:membrane protease YdiL (CAAX protease family)